MTMGYFTDVNATYCDIYGYTKNELVGNHFTYVVPENKQKRFNTTMRFMEKEYELQGSWIVQG